MIVSVWPDLNPSFCDGQYGRGDGRLATWRGDWKVRFVVKRSIQLILGWDVGCGQGMADTKGCRGEASTLEKGLGFRVQGLGF